MAVVQGGRLLRHFRIIEKTGGQHVTHGNEVQPEDDSCMPPQTEEEARARLRNAIRLISLPVKCTGVAVGVEFSISTPRHYLVIWCVGVLMKNKPSFPLVVIILAALTLSGCEQKASQRSARTSRNLSGVDEVIDVLQSYYRNDGKWKTMLTWSDKQRPIPKRLLPRSMR